MNDKEKDTAIITKNSIPTASEIKLFEQLLKKETQQLKEIEFQGLFSSKEDWEIGLELEGWFLNHAMYPKPLASQMISELKQTELSEEIAKDVFEINLKPLIVKANFLERFDENLTFLYKKCNDWAKKQGTKIITIGMLPNVSPAHFTRELLADHPRAQLLNDSLLQLRGQQPWRIKIQGDNPIDLETDSICLEALTTSTQFHLKVPHLQIVDTYNRAQMLAAPMVALAANAPYFNSHSLWHDTRIPLVQQTVSEQQPPNCWNNREDRVHFGNNYISHSIMELFENNLQFSSLVPMLDLKKTDNYHHIKIHNGSIWRWNRPVMGEDPSSGEYHIRLEHRVQSAGTSPSDIAAQLGFYVGILAFWQATHFQPKTTLAFKQIRDNFYHAAQYGLEAKIFWNALNPVNILDIIYVQLLPQAKKGLSMLGLSPEEISFYMDEVLGERLKRGLSGAVWQKNKTAEYGGVLRMLESYHHHQQELKPLWRWKDY